LLPAARSPRPSVDAAYSAPASATAEGAYGGRGEGYASTELRRSIAAGSDPLRSLPAAHATPAVSDRPGDDDPLTSPSFPRITDDSRSYRRGRGEAVSSTRSPGDQPGRGDPSFHPVPPVVPLPTADSQATAAYSRPARSAEYAAAPAEHYEASTHAADSHLTSAASASYSPEAPDGGYLPAGGLAYGAESGAGAYSASLPATYLPEPRGTAPYATPEPVGYSYSNNHDHGEYGAPAASYPAASLPAYPADLPAYPDYPAGAGSAADHSPPAPLVPELGTGYSYGHQQPSGYPDYQVPDLADPSLPYSSHEVQPDGLPPSEHPAYPPTQYTAQYEPAGYPASGYEPEGGYPADPYAVDPYGYPGYGASRLSDEFLADQPRLPDQEWDEPSWSTRQWDVQLSQGQPQDQPQGQPWPQEPGYQASWGDEQDWSDRQWEDQS
jgi:hypothetical protein